MKKLLLCLAVGFATMANAQQFEVVSIQRVKTGDRPTAYHPRFMPGGNTLMVCEQNYSGLGLVDIKKGEYKHLTDLNAAGYCPEVSEDGNLIVVREKDWDNLKVDLYKIDLKKETISPIATGLEHVNRVKLTNGELTFGQQGRMSNFATRTRLVNRNMVLAPVKDIYVTEEDLKLVVYINGMPSVIDPLSTADYDAQYFWSSLSPDKTRILFGSGNHTWVCNLDGSNLIDLGEFRAPVWRGNNFVVGMIDEDDGYHYTKSDIVIVKADGTQKMQQLTTNSKEIKMFPSVSDDGSKIAFHTEEGKIYLMQIKEK